MTSYNVLFPEKLLPVCGTNIATITAGVHNQGAPIYAGSQTVDVQVIQKLWQNLEYNMQILYKNTCSILHIFAF